MKTLSNPPLFIIGNPRSGTSLCRLFLGCHSNLSVPPECGFATWLHPKYKDWDDKSLTDQGISDFVSDLIACRKFATWRLSGEDIGEYLRQARPGDYKLLINAIYDFYRQKTKPRASRWGDKNNFYLNHIHLLSQLFSESLFLHIVRDPRDVYCSYSKLKEKHLDNPYRPDLPDDPQTVAELWAKNVSKILGDMEQLPDNRKLTVRYEDLVMDPVAKGTEVCEWLGESFEESMLTFYHANKENNLEPPETLPWKLKTLEPFDPSRVAVYKSDLSQETSSIIEQTTQGLLHRFHYDAS